MSIRSGVLPVILLSMLAITASAARAQNAPSSLTPAERESALKELQRTHDKFLQSISGLSPAQWTFKPAPDRWSVAEVSEHITLAEAKLLGLVQQQLMKSPAAPESRDQVKGKDELILQKVPDRSHKVQAPEFLRPTGQWKNREDLTKAFEENRRATMKYVLSTSDDLRDHFLANPNLGLLDGYQWILLVSAHSERHTAQIDEVKADPNFPK